MAETQPEQVTNQPEVPKASPVILAADLHAAKTKRRFPTPAFLLTLGLLLGLGAGAYGMIWYQSYSAKPVKEVETSVLKTHQSEEKMAVKNRTSDFYTKWHKEVGSIPDNADEYKTLGYLTDNAVAAIKQEANDFSNLPFCAHTLTSDLSGVSYADPKIDGVTSTIDVTMPRVMNDAPAQTIKVMVTLKNVGATWRLDAFKCP